MSKIKVLVKDSAYLAISGLACGIIGLISMVLMSKIYSPEEYGIFTAFIGVAAALSPISNLSLEYGIFESKNKHQQHYYNETLITALIVALLVYFIISILKFSLLLPGIYNICFEFPSILMLYVLFGGISRQLHAVAFKRKIVKNSATARILESLTHHLLFLCLGLLGFSYLGMQISSFIGFIAGVIYLAIKCEDVKLLSIKTRDLTNYKKFLIDNKRFILGKAPYVFIHNLNINAPLIFAAYFMTFQELGVFALAIRIARIPYIIFSNLHKSLLRTFSEIKSLQNLFKLYASLTLIMMIGAIVCKIILSYIPESLFTATLSSNWIDSFVILKVIIIWIFFEFTAFILGAIYQRIGYIKIQPILELGTTFIIFFCLYLTNISNKDSIEIFSRLSNTLAIYYAALILCPLFLIARKNK